MKEFSASLLREKFIIRPDNEEEEPIIALSNRMIVALTSPDGIDDETFIVRTQNMHSCARLAAAIVKEFHEHGTIANRATPFSWNLVWGDVIKGYERDWNPNIWCAIYNKGRTLYKKGDHHPFLDIIEQCDATNKGEYAQSVSLAEKAFQQAGKDVTIEHDSNIAMVMSSTSEKAKCGIIVRSASGATTFNYTAQVKEENPRPIHPYTILTVAASFLEAVQLAFQVGLMNRKKEYRLFDKYSDEDRQHRRATNRLANLNRAISNFEKYFQVQYRPDRPTFPQMVGKAEEASMKILKPLLEKKIEEGKLKKEDWVQ